MKLITELNEEIEYLTEGSGAEKKLYITGVYMQAGLKNKNGRIYAPEIMENAINVYTKERIERNCAYGELNHPETPKINLDRVSHIIKEMRRDGNNWIGKSQILETPMGAIAKGLLEGGARLAVSSRGMGSLKTTADGVMVCEDFRLSTAADIVSDPSAPDAFVNGVMEGAEWVYDPVSQSYSTERIVEQVKKTLDHSARALTEERRVKAFQLFLDRVQNIKLEKHV